MDHLNIKEWAESDRPREKLVKYGKESLSIAELLAILLRTGTSKTTALDLSRQVLSNSENDLTQLARLSVSDISKIKGLGPVKAITIVAALEKVRSDKAEKAAGGQTARPMAGKMTIEEVTRITDKAEQIVYTGEHCQAYDAGG